jgi:pimeloyl-ACP methyl ester carboxylesterase
MSRSALLSCLLVACAPASAPIATSTMAPQPSAPDPDGPPPGASKNARERDIEVGEVRLHVRITGEDKAPRTLLVIHGGPGASYEYITGLDALAGPGRRVVYVDERGVAPSTKPVSGDYRLETHIADLEGVRAAIGAERVDVLGHSWGTVVAGGLAARHPERVGAVVLVAPLALTSDVQARAFEKLGAYEDRLVPLGLATDHPPEPNGDDCTARDKARMRRYFADPRHPFIGMHGGRCYLESRKKSFEAIEGVDLTPIFAQVRGPVLVVTADEDPFGQEPYEQVVRALGAAKVATLTIPRCGHDPFLEAYPQTLAKLREWLDSAP